MFSLIEAFGVQVVEVDYLSHAVCLVDGERVALIRSDLDDAARAWAADWLLPQVVGLPSQPCA